MCVCDGFLKGHPSVIRSSRHGRCFKTNSPLSRHLLRNDSFDVVRAIFIRYVFQQKGMQDCSPHSSNQDCTVRQYTVFSSGTLETIYGPDSRKYGCLVVVIQGDWTCVESILSLMHGLS